MMQDFLFTGYVMHMSYLDEIVEKICDGETEIPLEWDLSTSDLEYIKKKVEARLNA